MGTTPNTITVFETIEQNDIECIKQLLKNGTNPNLQTDCGNTLLHFASAYNRLEIVKLLLEYGADPNIQNRGGGPPLCEASYECKYDIVMLLIDYGADCNLTNILGETALDYAGGDFIREYLETKEHQIVLK